MKFDDVKKKIIAIGTKGTIEEVRADLTELTKELETDYKNHEAVTLERDNLKNDNEDLRSANMKLFKQIGSPEPEPEDKGKDPEVEDLTYENLFNDEGGLK